MKYFIDTEFRENPNTIDLISIAIVSENNKKYYALSKDCDIEKSFKDEWLKKNVFSHIYNEHITGKMSQTLPFNLKSMKWLFNEYGKSNEELKNDIINFVDEKPEFYGYYCDYDWVVFCWIFGKMINLPKHFPMYCRDLKQTMDDRNLSKEWKKEKCPDNENAHNALGDAQWNLKLYKAMKKEKLFD
jgi:hypothetical protein